MRPNGWVLLLAAEIAFIAAAGYFFFVAKGRGAEPQFPAGQQIYVANCAQCHGANLEGQPDWMTRKPDGKLPAPPHGVSGHTWHHSDAQLFRITKLGPAAIMPGYLTDMPGFADILTNGQILAVLDYIKSTWPERQRTSQAARSQAEPIE